jgi:pimeloyl-ACP methyl ester carboxylesterase
VPWRGWNSTEPQEPIVPAKRQRILVRYGDISIDVIQDGEASLLGQSLVLLPSSSRDSKDFDAISSRFAATGFLVLRPQPRGMCGSTGPLEGLTLHDFARDIAAVIAQQANGPAFVLGHAFGQWVGRCLASDHPALVRGVILAAAAARQTDPALREALTRCASTTLPQADRLAALRLAFFAPGHDPHSWLRNWHPEAGRVQRAASSATPQAEWWGAGSAPVLDLQAALDPWRPRSTINDIRNELGADRVTVEVVPNASHALIPEQPDAVLRAVVTWMQAVAR